MIYCVNAHIFNYESKLYFMSIIGFIMGMVLELIVYSAAIIIFSFSIWMLVDAAKQDRFWWIAIILGVPIIGPAVYYFTEKKHEYVKAQSHYIHKSQTEAQHETSHEHHEHHRKEDVESRVLLADEIHESKNDGKNEEKTIAVKEIEDSKIV